MQKTNKESKGETTDQLWDQNVSAELRYRTPDIASTNKIQSK